MGMEERGFGPAVGLALLAWSDSGVSSNTGCLMSLISCFWWSVWLWLLYMWSVARLEWDGESRLEQKKN
jgi:hypothetical protein